MEQLAPSLPLHPSPPPPPPPPQTISTAAVLDVRHALRRTLFATQLARRQADAVARERGRLAQLEPAVAAALHAAGWAAASAADDGYFFAVRLARSPGLLITLMTLSSELVPQEAVPAPVQSVWDQQLPPVAASHVPADASISMSHAKIQSAQPYQQRRQKLVYITGTASGLGPASTPINLGAVFGRVVGVDPAILSSDVNGSGSALAAAEAKLHRSS